MAVHRFPSAPQGPKADTIADRMERLRHDAELVASEHADALLQALSDAATLAEQVSKGGEAYQVGVREIARRAEHDINALVLSLRAIRGRAH